MGALGKGKGSVCGGPLASPQDVGVGREGRAGEKEKGRSVGSGVALQAPPNVGGV